MRRYRKYSFLFIIIAGLLLSCSRDREFPVTTKSPEARALWDQAIAAEMNYQHTAAEELINSAIEYDSTFALAYVIREVVSGSPQKNLEAARRLSKNATEDERKLIESRYQYRILQNYDKAFEQLTEITEKYPDNLFIQLHRIGLLRQVKGDRVLEELESLQQRFPASPALHNFLGYAYYDAGNMEKAEHHFTTYIKLAPHLSNPYDSMGDFLRMQGRYSEALEYYEETMARDKDVKSLEKQLLCHALMQQYDQAWQDLNKASSYLQDNPVRSHTMRSALFLLEDQPDSAIYHMEEKSDIQLAAGDLRNYSYTRTNLIFFLLNQGRFEEAESELDKLGNFLTDNFGDAQKINYNWDDVLGLRVFAAALQGEQKKAKDHLAEFEEKLDRYKTPEQAEKSISLEPSQANVSVNLFGQAPSSTRTATREEQAEFYYRHLQSHHQFLKGAIEYYVADYDQCSELLRPMKGNLAAQYWYALAEMKRGNPQIARTTLASLASSGAMDIFFIILYPDIISNLRELNA